MVETGGSGGGISSHSSVEKRGQKVGERGRDGARLFPMTRPKVGCAGGRGRRVGHVRFHCGRHGITQS